MGFIEGKFDKVAHTYLEWRGRLATQTGGEVKSEFIYMPLPQALMKLQPLTTPPSRVLFIETKSQWTAYFDNGLRNSDPESPIGYLSTLLSCKSLTIHCSPDRSETKRPDMLRVYGIVAFRLFVGHSTEWLNQERAIVAMNDGGRWMFAAEGKMQSFEEPEKYKARKIRDRFTDEMLERYCFALGVKSFDEGFYGKRALVAELPNQLAPGSPVMSLEQARKHISLDKVGTGWLN